LDQHDNVKISVTLPADTVTDIETLSLRLGVTPSQLLQRAVSIEKYLDDVEDKNGIVLIKTADNKLKRITRS
jgi:predicted DNA-binding protein